MEWERFARSIQPPGSDMDVIELRDHAKDMLNTIAADLATPQTERKRIEKSKGDKPRLKGDTAAETHAEDRLTSGFSINLLAAEYRALRTSVLHLWLQENKCSNSDEVEEIIRFNEAIDQTLAESVGRYSEAVQTAQDVFLAILGHDLRSPLQSLDSGAQYLMHVASMETSHVQLGTRMSNSVMRMKGMLDNLMDFTQSRIGSGVQISPSETDLSGISEQVVEEFRSSNPDRGLRHEIIGDCRGRWDSGRIARVYQNLIGNALQYGSPESDVLVSSKGSPEEVVLTVHNDGPPISEKEQPRIFDLFRRQLQHVDEANPRKNMGLGLYITHEIVTAHQGTISVISTEADGTTFTVRLPKEKAS